MTRPWRRSLAAHKSANPPVRSDGVPRRRRGRRKGVAIFTVCAVALLAVAGYFAYSAFQRVTPFLTPAGCQAGQGTSAVSLAYATAMQESKMHNLSYGDLDSVGVFQQRPSEGWGTTSQLENPVYATTKFFGALTRVRGYLDMPVDQAAQAVQRSADGTAYSQYDLMATSMTSAFTGQRARAVWCWPGPGKQPQPNLGAVGPALAAVFGTPAAGRPVTSLSMSRSAKSTTVDVRVQPAEAWAVASWLVSEANAYGISDVHYGGYQWTSPAGTKGWQPDTGTASADSATSGSILLH